MTTPRSWTSSATWRRFAPFVALAALLPLASADARLPWQKRDRSEPAPAPTPKEPERAPKTPPLPLFPSALPLDPGPLPSGLANLSAQGCAACHVDAHAQWQTSAHATGWRSEAFTQAVRLAGAPACERCHLPLLLQRPLLVDDTDGIDAPVTAPNPAFDATLRLEGVTCATCHVRDGKIVASRPPSEVGEAPHPLAWSSELSDGRACATCHQLQWEGASTPFYDTWGEWERSPYAEAGVGCVDCHGRDAADARGFDHATPTGSGRAVSVLLDLPTLTFVRGDAPVTLGLTLQNTGAGHAYPTGSPFTGVRLSVRLEGPPGRDGAPTIVRALSHDLRRKLTDGPPWDTAEDTRLPAAGQQQLQASLAIEQGTPEGDWELVVELARTVGDELAPEPPLWRRALPIQVE